MSRVGCSCLFGCRSSRSRFPYVRHPRLCPADVLAGFRWVGIAAITVYAPTIFAEAGYSARKSQWMSGLNDVRDTFPLLGAVQVLNDVSQ